MHQLLELVPIVLFFIAYKMDGETISVLGYDYQFDGIFSATAVLMIATMIQVAVSYAITRKIEKKQLWMLAAIFVFGAATLLLRNELFIQWKPTIFNWGLAITFFVAQQLTGKNLLERMMGEQIKLPAATWQQLNWAWIANFAIVGALNLYVAYQFSEATWVSYKLYSSIGFTLLLMIITMVVVLPHIKEQDEANKVKEAGNDDA